MAAKSPVRIRLARPSGPQFTARTNKPFYHIVVTRPRKRRDARPIELLGTYDPLPQKPLGQVDEMGVRWQGGLKDAIGEKKVVWNAERLKFWLRSGADPSYRVIWLMNKAGILPKDSKFPGLWRLDPLPQEERQRRSAAAAATATSSLLSESFSTTTTGSETIGIGELGKEETFPEADEDDGPPQPKTSSSG